MLHKLTSLLLISTIALSLSACSTMRPIPREELSALQTKGTVLVTLKNGRELEIENPRVEGSQLVGYVEPEGYRAIELTNIESAAIRELDKKKTIGMATWGLVAAIVAIALMTDSDEPEPCPT